MADWQARTATTVSRVLCAATLLFVFFLPLHFHFSLSPQLSSQCSCLQVARTQVVLPDAAPAMVPSEPFVTLLEAQSDEWNFAVPQRPFVRGPPFSFPV